MKSSNKKYKYVYYVVSECVHENNRSVLTYSITRNKQIDSLEDIIDVANYIKEDANLPKVPLITFYNLLRIE